MSHLFQRIGNEVAQNPVGISFDIFIPFFKTIKTFIYDNGKITQPGSEKHQFIF